MTPERKNRVQARKDLIEYLTNNENIILEDWKNSYQYTDCENNKNVIIHYHCFKYQGIKLEYFYHPFQTQQQTIDKLFTQFVKGAKL